jgi:hypothetical protein
MLGDDPAREIRDPFGISSVAHLVTIGN